MSKSLIVEKIASITSQNSYDQIASALHVVEWNNIDQSPWLDAYPYQPKAKFQIAFTAKDIILHYAIEEEYVKAQ